MCLYLFINLLNMFNSTILIFSFIQKVLQPATGVKYSRILERLQMIIGWDLGHHSRKHMHILMVNWRTFLLEFTLCCTCMQHLVWLLHTLLLVFPLFQQQWAVSIFIVVYWSALSLLGTKNSDFWVWMKFSNWKYFFN